ncbi:MAG: SHOCT domain-containing protein [Anaerolineales bacterium]
MPRGFGGGFRGGGFRGGWGMRRGGFPLIGMGMGMGGPLMTGLMAGGLGYLLGSNTNQQQPPQVMQVPYQGQPAAPASPSGEDKLTQLKLLGELHDRGVLTDEEFTREKNQILGR